MRIVKWGAQRSHNLILLEAHFADAVNHLLEFRACNQSRCSCSIITTENQKLETVQEAPIANANNYPAADVGAAAVEVAGAAAGVAGVAAGWAGVGAGDEGAAAGALGVAADGAAAGVAAAGAP